MTSIFPWIILLAPLLSTAVITLFTLRWKALSSSISIAAVLVSFICSCLIFAHSTAAAGEFTWIGISGVFQVPFGLTLDPLSRTMAVLVSGIGAIIHIYSLGYMRDDEGKSRYFAALSLFMFAMLGIVLGNNFVMLFIFWELVGFTSFLWIGHWFYPDAAADAAKKAFITTRIGDFGFMLGILMVWMGTDSVVFTEIAQRLWILTSHPAFLTIAALLVFCGAVGKSAQFPLHVWLPDAMEGPTPISALIHAATMVAAGVYMLVRVAFIIQASSTALLVIAWIGTITAVTAALIATQQNDIKRILAYSTLSQLGYMIMAVGLASGEAAMFHLFTHAFFKALLFLGAGSVLVALHHEQDIWKMGGQGRNLFLTIVAMLLGATGSIFLYRGPEADPGSFAILRRKFYFDEFYRALINATQELLARISAFVDRWVIDATAVRGTSGATWSLGALLRLMQVGNLQAYAFMFGLGIVWIIYFALFR